MAGYSLSPAARADLESIWDYAVTHWGEAQAEDYTRKIQAACEALSKGTIITRSAEDIREGYRGNPRPEALERRQFLPARRVQRRLDTPAMGMAAHHHVRDPKRLDPILHRRHHAVCDRVARTLRRHQIRHDPHHEEVPGPGAENQRRVHARVAARNHQNIRFLAF